MVDFHPAGSHEEFIGDYESAQKRQTQPEYGIGRLTWNRNHGETRDLAAMMGFAKVSEV